MGNWKDWCSSNGLFTQQCLDCGKIVTGSTAMQNHACANTKDLWMHAALNGLGESSCGGRPSTLEHQKVTCPACCEWLNESKETTMVNTRGTIHYAIGNPWRMALGAVCGELGDTSDDYHKVTCPQCEQWIREHADNISAKQHKAPLSREVVSIITDEVVGQMMDVHDQRRWELAKELYTKFFLPDQVISQMEQFDKAAAKSMLAAEALLDTFDKKHIDPDVTALIAAMDNMPQCRFCYHGSRKGRECDAGCTCACHEVAECVKRLEGKS